ncbi:MAG: hypothetical protein HQL40_13310 [Alphaproteobacteria bacterium]|nr:hypothetical protein [Alphaproteobacteria bacterium]
MDLFFAEPREPGRLPGAANIGAQIRGGLTKALKETAKSRAEVAAGMTDLLFGDVGDDEITKAQLDSWTAASKDGWRFPLEYLPAFIQATGAVWLLDLVAGHCGCTVLQGKEALLAEIGAVALAEKRLKARRASIERRVPGALLDQLMRELEARHG